MTFSTNQENFWAGDFGNEYISRNQDINWIASNTVLFSKIFQKTKSVQSIIEFGANIGLNLKAISQIMPSIEMSAIEINQKAAEQLKSSGQVEVFNTSILDFKPEKTWDFVLIKGVLIHINPERLQNVYQALYNSSNEYICIAEYYNPSPVELGYRGHEGKLFKRDFAGEILDQFPDLNLVDYGFVYHRDNNFTQDDITWFLLKK